MLEARYGKETKDNNGNLRSKKYIIKRIGATIKFPVKTI